MNHFKYVQDEEELFKKAVLSALETGHKVQVGNFEYSKQIDEGYHDLFRMTVLNTFLILLLSVVVLIGLIRG